MGPQKERGRKKAAKRKWKGLGARASEEKNRLACESHASEKCSLARKMTGFKIFPLNSKKNTRKAPCETNLQEKKTPAAKKARGKKNILAKKIILADM